MAKRDTFLTGPRSTYRVQSPLKEAAKFLASTARRFAHDKATIGDVEVAITEWRAAVNDPMSKRDRDHV